jgi:glutamate receptor, ionotropic, plant
MHLIAGGRLVSNLSRIAIIVWVFVVLILQASYTASLTSTLTVQRLTPTFSDMNELLKSEKNIGYLTDSFTRDFLIRSGFHESRLLPFKSPYTYEEALSNHSIAAVVDETPYLQVFLNKYCDNYTMVNLQNKTSGFGFVSLPHTLHLYKQEGEKN